jgi:hypothetical protein
VILTESAATSTPWGRQVCSWCNMGKGRSMQSGSSLCDLFPFVSVTSNFTSRVSVQTATLGQRGKKGKASTRLCVSVPLEENLHRPTHPTTTQPPWWPWSCTSQKKPGLIGGGGFGEWGRITFTQYHTTLTRFLLPFWVL